MPWSDIPPWETWTNQCNEFSSGVLSYSVKGLWILLNTRERVAHAKLIGGTAKAKVKVWVVSFPLGRQHTLRTWSWSLPLSVPLVLYCGWQGWEGNLRLGAASATFKIPGIRAFRSNTVFCFKAISKLIIFLGVSKSKCLILSRAPGLV